jgi:catechol 2,3-dioxygenase-like lactoylglutathione lyase family enzyme
MINHITLHVTDIDTAKNFYKKTLGPLGYAVTGEYPEWKLVGMGVDGKADLWLIGDGAQQAVHVAFVAPGKEAVQGFFDGALTSGGKDNGAPGYRKDYSPGYYAAFVTDPDGHNIEAVFIDPAGTPE